ncbi:MAG TPA: dUTP diphosphatase [Gaiellales bacterium]|nr:dUTP diphosphatase [Gaiellales bacterium]
MREDVVLELPVRLLHPDARPPSRAYEGDAGFDLVSVEAAELAPGARASLGCGIAIELPAGTCGLVLPRSGLARDHGVTVLNSPGLVDSGYRGELRVTLINTDREHAFEVEPGMRIAQLVVVALPQVAVTLRDELAASARGQQGFGSSGHHA